MLNTRTSKSLPIATATRQVSPNNKWLRPVGYSSLAMGAVFLTTCGLWVLNSLVSAAEPHIYVRPYIALFVMTVLLMTWIGGRSLGIFTLALCILTSLYYLLPPHGWHVSHPSDWAGLALLTSNSAIVIFGFDSLRQKAVLRAEAAGARQTNTRYAQEAVEANVRLKSVVEAANSHEQEGILKQLLLPVLAEQIVGLDLKVHYALQPKSTNNSTAFFDVFPVREDLTALLVGTVAEEGMPAASRIAMIRLLLRSIVLHSETLAEAVTELNTILVAHHLVAGPGRLSIGLYQAATQTLTSVCCGEALALIRRTATGVVEKCVEASPLLGLTASAEFRQQSVHLYPGDLIFLSPEGTAESALAVPSSATDAGEWIGHFLQADQNNRPHGSGRNNCLLAARVLAGKSGGSIGEAHDE
jgi:hypothetical protein